MKTGQAINKKIIESGKSVREVAIEAGISSQTIYQWIWGKSEPNIFPLICVADVLGVALDDLVGSTVNQ